MSDDEATQALRRMEMLDSYYLPYDQDPFAPSPSQVAERYCPGDARCGSTSCTHMARALQTDSEQ